MRIRGRRVLIAGSASRECDPNRLAYAHELVRGLVRRLASEGALFVVLVGQEPRISPDQGGHALIFDWTTIEVLHEMVTQGLVNIPSTARLVTTVVTSKTEEQVPNDRRSIWNELKKRDCVGILPGEWSWRSGAIRRALLASHADVLVTLGGGVGVEHYGTLFLARSKPVIPLDLEVGSSSNDGNGGSLRVLQRVRSDPQLSYPHTPPDSTNALLQSLITRQGKTPATEVIDGVLHLLQTIAPPTAFYVRLLNPEVAEFNEVERFFRTVVDPFVQSLDYAPVQMGRTPANKPLLDVEIFTRMHESTLVIADITAARPNCLFELGYALALGRQVVVTAMKTSETPFDIQSVDRFIWDPQASAELTLNSLRHHWELVRTRPALVEASRGL